MEESVLAAAVTLSFAVPVTPFMTAVMFVLPAASPLAMPDAAMPATALFEELQVTVAVRFLVEPSL